MADKQKTLLGIALEYYSAGINVVKTRYKGKCPSKDGEWKKYRTEPALLEQLGEWFGPEAVYGNISAITGPASSGLTALDCDSEQAYLWWAEKHPDFKTLPKVKSGRGYHVYFRSGLKVDKSFGKIELKANGLVSLPPSMHKSNVRYKWLIPLPDNVSELPLLDPLTWNLEDFTDGSDGSDGSEGKDGSEGVGKGLSRVKIEEFKVETQAAIEEAIKKALPKTYGQRYGLIWRCCQNLLAIDEIKHRAWDELASIGDIWHKRALPNIEHKSLTMTQARFKDAWEAVKYPVGDGKSLEIAKEAAFSSTEPMPELKGYEGDEVMEKIIRLCFELQRLAGPDDCWFIPINKANELFGISHTWLSVILKRLDGKLIKRTKKYTARRSNRYIFIGPSISLLCEEKRAE